LFPKSKAQKKGWWLDPERTSSIHHTKKKVKQLESKLHAKEVDGQPISADNVKYSCMLISYDILEVIVSLSNYCI